MKNLIVTIMSAGEGKRMNSDIPKVLHNFNGIPMLIRIILEVIKIHPKKIIIITGKYDLMIKKTIKEYYEFHNMNTFNDLIFIKQDVPNGTGGAIKCTLDIYSDTESVLILNGDMPLLSSELLKNFINNNISNKLLISEIDSPYGYGRILIDKNNKFIGIKEEKDCNENEKIINLVNVGIYLLESKVLKTYIPLINNNNSQNEYYLTDIFKLIINNSNIEINTYIVDKNLKYQINGVNTKEELILLEKSYNKNIN